MPRVDSANEYFVFTNRETGADLVPAAPNFTHVPQAVRATKPAATPACGSSFNCRTRRGACGSIACSTPGSRRRSPRRARRLPSFTTCSTSAHPEHFRPLDLAAWRFFLYWSARKSERLIAVSDATKTDLVHYYHLEPERIDVIGHGVEAAFFELPPIAGTRAVRPLRLDAAPSQGPRRTAARLRPLPRLSGRAGGWCSQA